MTLPRDEERIAHMVEACEEGLAFVAGRVRSDLGSDRVLLLARASSSRTSEEPPRP
jgi:hypothetical protein